MRFIFFIKYKIFIIFILAKYIMKNISNIIIYIIIKIYIYLIKNYITIIILKKLQYIFLIINKIDIIIFTLFIINNKQFLKVKKFDFFL